MKHSVIFSLFLLYGTANAFAEPPELSTKDSIPSESAYESHARDIAVLEDADGSIVLTDEPCVFNETIKAKTANLPQENIYRVYATSKEGTQQGCWLMFNPPEKEGFVPIYTINLFTESGYVISYGVDRFQPLNEDKQASFHFKQ